MPIPNRELSQFGSFLFVDNTTRNIGIATTTTPYVGIGTTNPSVKLTVIGDTNISGVISATGYYLNGNQLVSAAVQTWELSGSNVYRSSGNVGIGSTIPTEKLDVIGNTKTSGLIVSGIVTTSQLVSTVAIGTAPLTVTSTTLVTNLNADFLRGKVAPSGDIVGTTDTQTLTNKTLTSPILTSAVISTAGIAFSGSTSGTTTLRASAVATGIATLPALSTSDTLVARNTTDTLTNKTISAGSNTITGLTNSNLSGSAAITNSNLANSTISGVSLGSTLNNLIRGNYISYSSGTTYNGSTPITVSVAATTLNTANTVVARDSSGDFSTGTITCSNLNASFSVTAQSFSGDGSALTGVGVSVGIDTTTNGTFYPLITQSSSGIVTTSSVSTTKLTFNPSSGTLTAIDFNSTSDKNLKEEIKTIDNAVEIINQLRGVDFVWKENKKPSMGVVAQELEQIIPQLVSDTNPKTVNYNGLIGVLIEAIKELSVEVQEIKSQINNQ
jgi:hypothetical protein